MYHSSSGRPMPEPRVEWLLAQALQQSWKMVSGDAGDSTPFVWALRKATVSAVCDDKLDH